MNRDDTNLPGNLWGVAAVLSDGRVTILHTHATREVAERHAANKRASGWETEWWQDGRRVVQAIQVQYLG